MHIDMTRFPSVWLENADGVRFSPYHPETNDIVNTPDGFDYQWSCFPGEVVERCLTTVKQSVVDECDHPMTHVHETGGWIDGWHGIECKKCGGTKNGPKDAAWANIKWEGGKNYTVAAFTTMPGADLIEAMIKADDYGLDDAMRIAAHACERCMNVLLHKYGVGDGGYEEGSEQWHAANTECGFCTPGDSGRGTVVYDCLNPPPGIDYTYTPEDRTHDDPPTDGVELAECGTGDTDAPDGPGPDRGSAGLEA